ncbi:MAG: MGMT family protein [Gemmatimonadales bacterium]|nr:MAG: MGMT family protein [Gemmatimonadales bacterium]
MSHPASHPVSGTPPVSLQRLVLPETPVGPLTLVASALGIREIRFGLPSGPDAGVAGPGAGTTPGSTPGPGSGSGAGPGPHLEAARRCLDWALAGPQGDGDPPPGLPPLDLDGHTAFRLDVWDALLRIPRGEVMTYGDIAGALGRGSPRAVGQAVGANPIPVLVPCHRVVAGDGRLGGFSGGLERKVTLLELEGLHPSGARFEARLDGPEHLELDLG